MWEWKVIPFLYDTLGENSLIFEQILYVLMSEEANIIGKASTVAAEKHEGNSVMASITSTYWQPSHCILNQLDLPDSLYRQQHEKTSAVVLPGSDQNKDNDINYYCCNFWLWCNCFKFLKHTTCPSSCRPMLWHTFCTHVYAGGGAQD